MISTKRNALNILIDNVDLNSYSSSKGFVGYLEKSGCYSDQLVRDVVAIFSKFVCEHAEETFLVSSLYVDDDVDFLRDESDLTDKQIASVENLASLALLKKIHFDDFGDDYDSEEYQNEISNLALEFDVNPILSLDIDNLSLLMRETISNCAIGGHCFLVLVDKKVIFYPHDDVGFGMISEDESIDLAFEDDFFRLFSVLEGIEAVR